MLKRKICVVTGSRAEYGLFCYLLQEIAADSELELQIIATGAHLSPEFGLTYKTIETDGFIINEKVEILLASDSPTGMAKSLGLGIIGLADALLRLQPDLLVVLGDRYETLAAAQAAMLARIPIAHIAGGEITAGAVDEAIRHAISKMAHLHFAAAEPYRKRVIQLGENPERVFNYGSTGLDYIKRLGLLNRRELEARLDFQLGKPFFLVTYHPPTLASNLTDGAIELMAALDEYPQAHIMITAANADMGGRMINQRLREYAQERPGRVLFCLSLGQIKYLSCLQHCDVVIGNSSSAIIEAPALKKATVNIGSRQQGRLKADSIIDCQEERQEIKAAIDRALSPEFRSRLANVRSLYGAGDAAGKIKEKLKTVELTGLINKQFYDLDFIY